MFRTIVKFQSAFLLTVANLKATSGTFDHVTTDNEITNQILEESVGKPQESACDTLQARENVSPVESAGKRTLRS